MSTQATVHCMILAHFWPSFWAAQFSLEGGPIMSSWMVIRQSDEFLTAAARSGKQSVWKWLEWRHAHTLLTSSSLCKFESICIDASFFGCWRVCVCVCVRVCACVRAVDSWRSSSGHRSLEWRVYSVERTHLQLWDHLTGKHCSVTSLWLNLVWLIDWLIIKLGHFTSKDVCWLDGAFNEAKTSECSDLCCEEDEWHKDVLQYQTLIQININCRYDLLKAEQKVFDFWCSCFLWNQLLWRKTCF